MDKSAIRWSLRWVVCAIALGAVGIGLRAGAQAPSGELSFEVATVKVVDPSYRFDGKRFWAHVSPVGASYWYMTLSNLVSYAYDVPSFQVTGPEWTTVDHFDIEARFPEGADKKDDKRMLQALLKDRYQLAFHIEKRELESYVLIVGKRGAKLTPSAPDPVSPQAEAALKAGDNTVAAEPAKVVTTKDGTSKIDQGKRGTFSVKFDPEHWTNHLEYSKMTMEQLAGRLGGCLSGGAHKVVDETGIKGNYQVAYDCPLPRPAVPGSAGTVASDPQDDSSLIRSLDALGLKLERRKMLTDVYVIDRAERPSGN